MEANTTFSLLTSVTESFRNDSNTTDATIVGQPFCRQILYMTIGTSLVQVWDVLILCPNAIFLLYLTVKMHSAISKLRRNNSPMLSAYFFMVCVAVGIGSVRCVISMAVHAVSDANITDRVMWLVLKFFLLATEISVVSFSLWFGHLDSHTSIRRVLIVTFSISLAYSTTQGVLEFLYHNDAFHNIPVGRGNLYTLFGHGGMLFWFISSLCLCLIYVFILLLPCAPVAFRQLFNIPSKTSFYVYCGLLAMLDAAQAIGSGMIYFGLVQGMCVVDITTFFYFTGLAPLIYVIFLRAFFSLAQPTTILFSYKSQVDEAEADDVNLPQHTMNYTVQGVSTLSDVASSFDSTHFNGAATSPNPLYRLLDNNPDFSHSYRDFPSNSSSLVGEQSSFDRVA